MLETQAERLIERLKSACTYHRFDEPRVQTEYIRVLVRYDYDRMNEAIDAAIEDDSRNVPPISVLVKKYREISEQPSQRNVVRNEQYCGVCDDKGFVLMKEKHPGSGLIYEYVLYCPFCPVGRSQAYDGSQCKNRRSSYRVPPLTEYFDDEGIKALQKANLKRRAKKKFIPDALVVADTIQNGSYKCIQEILHKFSVNKKNPRMEAEILETGECVNALEGRELWD